MAFFKAVDFGGSNRKVMKISTVIKPENYRGFYDFFLRTVSFYRLDYLISAMFSPFLNEWWIPAYIVRGLPQGWYLITVSPELKPI